MRKSFLKKYINSIYIVERTNKAEVRSEEQSEKAESCRENLWNKIQLEVPQRQKQTQEQNKRSGHASSVSLCQRHKTATSPPREGEPVGTRSWSKKVKASW